SSSPSPSSTMSVRVSQENHEQYHHLYSSLKGNSSIASRTQKSKYFGRDKVSTLFTSMVADEDTHVIIHVRYVCKDLWVKMELPRDISVSQAKDLILERCQISTNSR